MRPPVIAAIVVSSLGLMAVGGALAWYGMAWRMGWFSGPPRLASGLWAVTGTISPTWSRRLIDRFPIGSTEARLMTELRAEGFEVDGGRKLAGYGWARYPCIYTLTVRWRADSAGRVRAVQGGLHNACTEMDQLLPDRPPRRRPRPAEPEPAPLARSSA